MIIFLLLVLFGNLLGVESVYNVDPAKEPGTLRIMTFNVRYKHKEDEKEHNWKKRLPYILQMIDDFQPDVIGMQEPLHSQVEDLEDALKEFKWVGRSRGKTILWGLIKVPGSEYNPIFYSKNSLDLKNHKTFWLNPDNEWAEPAWGASLPRICTWARFKDCQGRILFILNTHLDHSSSKAREKGFELVASKADKKARKKGPTMITGDLNASIYSFNSTMEEYNIIDAKKEAPDTMSRRTYHNWGRTSRIIDHILAVNDGRIEILRYAVIERTDHLHLSDHNPVFVDIKLS